MNGVLRKFACAVPFGLVTLASQTSFAQSIATYSFDDASGTTLSDVSGNSAHGTLRNSPAWSTGKYAGGLTFTGNNYVSIGDLASADALTSFTVSTWVKFAAAGGGAGETHLVDKSRCDGHANGGPFELGVAFSRSHKAEFIMYPAGGSPAALLFSGASTTSVDDGQWHHVTGRYDGTELSIWVNGVQENALRVPGLRTPNTSHQLELGGNCNGYQYLFRGTLDDVRVYNRALTQAEIQADMASPAGGGSVPPADTTAPSTPASLRTTSVSATSVALAWNASTDNTGVTGYRIYRNGTQVRTATGTSVTDSGLTSNTSYTYSVAAYDAAGNVSSQSTALAVTTSTTTPPPDSTAPTTPQSLQASNVTSTSATLSWQASSDNIGVTGYRIYRNGTQVRTSTGTSVTETGLTASTTYSYAVAAYDAAGNLSPLSSARSVTTSAGTPPADTTAPSVPTGVQSSNVTTTSLTLSWQASSDNLAVTGYRIFRNGVQVRTSTSTSVSETGLSPSTAYAYTVSAYDAAGNASNQSSTHNVTTGANQAPPSNVPAVASYGFSEGSGTTLLDQSGNGNNGTLRNGPVWGSGRTGGGLTFDGSDDYVSLGDIAATDGLNRFTVSAWVKFTTAGGAASEIHLIDKSGCNGHTNGGPWELGVSTSRAHKAEFLIYPVGGSPAPLLFSGASTTSVDDGQWHYVTGRYDGTQLSIWVDGVQEAAAQAPGLTMASTGNQVELGGRCNGYMHGFRGTLDDVRIYDRALTAAEIQSDMANAVGGGSTNPPPSGDTTPPSTPTSLRSSNVTANSVTLTWNASSDNTGVAGYRLYRNGTQVRTATGTSVQDTGLAANTTYTYTVAAYDGANNLSGTSTSHSVTTSTSTPPPSGGGTYSTSFNTNENPVSEGGAWRRANNNWTNVQVVNGVAFGTNGVQNIYDDSYALLSGFGADQSVEAVVFRDNSQPQGPTHEVELLLRFSDDSGNARGYELLFDQNGPVMTVRWNGAMGNFTVLGHVEEHPLGRPLQSGDVIKATIVGSTITTYINGKLISRAIDSAITSGQPGMGFFIRPGGSQRFLGLTSYTATSP